MSAKFVYDGYGYVVHIIDDYNIEWSWGPNKFYVSGTVAQDPHTGYDCEFFNVQEALDILFSGGYISEESYHTLMKKISIK